ncbi:carbamoyl-phosphate synthase large subunit [Campylobacter canadensis]|uniref:Carbamoyl-phosphate synthase large subunit n=1 Tax=Campylobacter canadensis TaxID=449520 RepID=A0ABS7WVC9_9BACT|nr:carbamoyl-phosphate synthase large subunit [Campylobacter canadensis]MBZ7987879.1 carbamoyl-phosphate synthase large subunit [Campylobacter canadensis]MBZ7995329.1 carbamoyl-phosphate synthase large subunit [Campylobacter canadensis]MBZ7996345.1 carbamoyl-phosphate synthase large subunit [Campylobacter canadensis]MBZ7998377.1 carbamoyl-phosphate synthase large subunit [Campylobacter canadensis]MBZ8000092.1 carbamoyl-phosphate synthase large subunit [Campylobacter canadensis]
MKKSVLVIGSGPIVIGSAAEFDYAGVQACLAFKKEGLKVILINSNPATIMTDKNIADEIYLEPLNAEFVSKVIRKCKPDYLFAACGGQNALNIAIEVSALLKEFKVKVIGTSLKSIKLAESRKSFKELMNKINEPIPSSTIATSIKDALNFAKQNSYPVVVRPAYTMGGLGGGIARSEEELIKITKEGLIYSPIKQCLIEQSILGLSELEFEVLRDEFDNAIVVCGMENIDPVGVHTGDSMVVAPILSIEKSEIDRMCNVALKIAKSADIKGSCNVQIAYNKQTKEYFIIEINPRLSRSSALASKATSFAIAQVAAQIALKKPLDKIYLENGQNCLEFNNNIDYIVTKMPRFAFDKFKNANRNLTTQMKSTGEAMGLGISFSESFLKALRSIDYKVSIDENKIEENIKNPSDERIYYILRAFELGMSVEKVYELSKIDKYFLNEFKKISQVKKELENNTVDEKLFKKAKQIGFSNEFIKNICKKDFKLKAKYKVPLLNHNNKIPCYFSSFSDECKDENIISTSKKKIIVLGSGPIKIGQGIEFDYSSVKAIMALRSLGYEAIIINNNPETLSTDFSIANKLYFEPLTLSDVLPIIELEKPLGVIVSFGGQSAINLACELAKHNVNIIGTSLESINIAENRQDFSKLLDKLNIKQAKATYASKKDEILTKANEIKYPVIVRPSFVLGGAFMRVIVDENAMNDYIKTIDEISTQKPLLIDKYLEGKELELDAICDGENVFIPGILELIERAGVHSGDSIAITPPLSIEKNIILKAIDYTKALSKGLNVKGLMNIQFVLYENELYVLEVNLRASRSLPFLCKANDMDLVKMAINCMLGEKLNKTTYFHNKKHFSVKAPVFSFAKLSLVDPVLGPEMKSTGEVASSDKNPNKALLKALIASGMSIKENGGVLFSIDDKNKANALYLAKEFALLGFKIYATNNTSKYFKINNLECTKLNKLAQNNEILEHLSKGKINLVINTPSNANSQNDGFLIRRSASECGVACISSLDSAKAYLDAIKEMTLCINAL